MKRIVILGSTGSIGTQVLDVVSRLPDRLQVVGIAANRNVALLAEQAQAHRVQHVCVGDDSLSGELRNRLASGAVRLYSGVAGMCELATIAEADLVVVSVAGAVGIAPTHAAIEAGKDIALASKEVLVAAGEHTMARAQARGVHILPIDSEHSAIFQCLQGAPEHSIEKILLTASGGPFRATPREEFSRITVEQALKHPTWNMGGLVTINSATLMNKGLEIIEAHWLFGVPVTDVEVVVHPQSIVHSLVRFKDGSVLAQLGLPDMRLPIQYALLYPERPNTGLPRLDLTAAGALTFEKPDETKFPALRIARDAVQAGGTMPAVMNAANEAAVARFLNREIPFTGIPRLVETVMARHSPVSPTYEQVLDADAWARRVAADVQLPHA